LARGIEVGNGSGDRRSEGGVGGKDVPFEVRLLGGECLEVDVPCLVVVSVCVVVDLQRVG
jgi:hypothetical protein